MGRPRLLGPAALALFAVVAGFVRSPPTRGVQGRRLRVLEQPQTEAEDALSSLPPLATPSEEAGDAPEDSPAGPAKKKKMITLRRFMLDYAHANPEMHDLESLMASVEMACKTIALLVQRNGLPHSEDLGGASQSVNVQGEEQKRLDVVSNDVLKDALRYTGRLGVVASEEETHPVLIEEAYDSKFVAVFDPLDGSSNIDAAIATGTIFGIFRQTEECGVLGVRSSSASSQSENEDGVVDVADDERCLLNALQPGESLVAAGYAMYSSSCVLVVTLGDGVFGFTLDPTSNEFVLTHDRIQIPKRGSIYSVNEANSHKWAPWVQSYVHDMKRGLGQTGTPYSARYVGSMVADVHRTLLYGGVYAYPADAKHLDGKIRLLYEAAPMSFLVTQAGGRASTGAEDIMAIHPTRVHQRVPCFLGSAEDIDELESYYARRHDLDAAEGVE